jgi:hypothetical protein
MELIPILSTIILVATICTFILAIGAYILYKIRERKGQQVPYPKPSTVRAELVTPGETEYKTEEQIRQVEMQAPKTSPGTGEGYKSPISRYTPVGEEHYRNTRSTGRRKFLKYTSEGYIPTEEDKNTGVLRWR